VLGCAHGQNARTSHCANFATAGRADQEEIGRRLPSHVEELNSLRGEIDKGIGSLDAGRGSALDIEDFLRRKNSRHGGA
jgi:hypothetical protein